jgi:hypothetical protein
MADFVYLTEQEYPSIHLVWKDGDGNLINFASGYTWTVRLAQGSEAIVEKTTGIVGSSTSPNVTINWTIGELDIAEGLYQLVVIATDNVNKDRVFRPGAFPTVQIVTTPTIPGD